MLRPGEEITRAEGAVLLYRFRRRFLPRTFTAVHDGWDHDHDPSGVVNMHFIGVAAATSPIAPASIDSVLVPIGSNISSFLSWYRGGILYGGPHRPGYNFAGWYFDSAFTIPLTADSTVPPMDFTLHARWVSEPGGGQQGVFGSFNVIVPRLYVRVALVRYGVEVDHQMVRDVSGAPVGFAFMDVEPGVYSLVFSRPGHTRFTVHNVVVVPGGFVDLTQAADFPAVLPLWPGDMNGDGVIDIADLQLFTTLMLAGDASADLNGDGFVNAFDRNLLMAHMGRESEYIILP